MPQLPFPQSPMTFRLIIKEMYGCINMEIMMVLILKLTNWTGIAIYHHQMTLMKLILNFLMNILTLQKKNTFL